MTGAMMKLRALVRKAPNSKLLREVIGFATPRLREMEVEGAGRGR
jgi:hypothetical protein